MTQEEVLNLAKSGAKDLSGCNFDGIDVSGLDLRDCDFTRCTFNGTIFRDCDLSRAIFSVANIFRCDFTGAVCRETVFSTVFSQCVFDRCDLTKAVFRGAHIESCSFIAANFSGANFNNATLGNGNTFTELKIDGATNFESAWATREVANMSLFKDYAYVSGRLTTSSSAKEEILTEPESTTSQISRVIGS